MDLIDATQRSLQRVNTALAAEKRHAAEAAHALRTPVAVLMARLDALPPGQTTERLRADLAALSRTVRQVLASARADSLAGGDHRRTDLAPIVDSVTAALAPLAYEKGVELSLSQLAPSVLALADADGVELALVNLVENAIIHGASGTVEISVGPGPEIRVRDHGPGVPPGERERLFEPFWRDDRAPPGGTGLGLAIVDRLQQAQKGSVSVEAPPGGGAEFTLSFRPAD
jgi:two-component system OmpR family sensor kinase